VDAVAAELNLRESNLAAAKRALAEIRCGNEVPSEYERLICARLLVAEGELRKAESILGQLERAAVHAQRLGTLIAIHLQQALCKSAQGDRTGALERIGRAVSLAAPEANGRDPALPASGCRAEIRRVPASIVRPRRSGRAAAGLDVRSALNFHSSDDSISPGGW